MPKLVCNVSNCGHNKSNLCCNEGIQVGGQQALSSSATCCDSFVEKSGAFTNDFESAKASLSISCEAHNCTYNQIGACAAEAVSISGVSASVADQTQCNSFAPKM